ncbi:MAG: FlgD immunoglobulin-like domain containing protein [bacterium]
MKTIVCVMLGAMVLLAPATAPAVLFDFDNAPLHSSLPIDLTVGGITAHFTATGQGFSIQQANVLGFTPVGFYGYCIYPNSVYAADLLISFSTPLTDFSIMYAPEEYACDSSALMRVTAYLDAALVGTATATADPPGTWPTGTLAFSSLQPFNNVVVHYAAPPPTGGDWGPIFMADNMNVTPAVSVSVREGIAGGTLQPVVSPNPFVAQTTLHFGVRNAGPVSVTVHDVAGRLVRTLLDGVSLQAGARSLSWDGRDDEGREVMSGVYLCRVSEGSRVATTRMILVRAR